MTRKILYACLAALLLVSEDSYAWDLSAGGFLQGNYSLGIDGSNPDGGDFKWGEERGQLKLEGAKEPLRLFLKADISFDHLDRNGEVEPREAYIDLTRQRWDLRAGRQIITWGLGDLIFINDVFPKDYEAFFSGRPLEYLKIGVDAMKAGFYPDIASFELVVIPFFEPNNFPDPNRFWTFDPLPDVGDRTQKEPASNLKNTEVALRAYRDIAGFDASVYLYKGFYRAPSLVPDSLTSTTRIDFIYPELSVYGVSLQRSALAGVVGLEAGYYDSLDDRDGTDPLIPNSQTRFLLSYQRQFIEDFSVTVQYYGEYTYDYSEYESTHIAGFPKEPRFRDLTSLRMTYLLMRQNLRLQWFSFWSPTDKDYLFNPEAKYNFSDSVWAALGANIFGGKKDTTQFGSLDRNDNIYIQARYEF
ncbi:MAG TPA: hypothetical protein DDW94_06700 [Deltaproteobacteria bacterium]|nr:MAG: hypothetical protein A2Z79_01230 [Deltaproteobacteria bacterium GWA2_55_82]OGQ62085.1 MAG: hypothetical protein A3I81_03975 [Deltaproteobacteria bacterium RIFCSPLOWO2_02_FULL_55_12]OIJ74055.1 MAG: hypothetical protein A2V21_307140 [Deltaproteobacteria bacterium GWC2_55_46]HBG46666.1 hypothetical protein [Deltaproteobacteria bacterium]HCY11326.1 hypothetical protein [Deltaproteobacteria bacterium]